MLLLEAIAEVESNNRVVVGDHGAALSVYQIHREVWQDVKLRFGQDSKKCDVGESFEAIGGKDDNSRIRAFNTAQGHETIIIEFLVKHGIEIKTDAASAEHIYACWNLGMKGYRRRHFKLSECPLRTITGAREVTRLLAEAAAGKKSLGSASRLCH